ncbi:hypothetical protein GCM10009804_75320 [Kribbella hippodromi]|uniref:Uncharacterized protein n=1 Tax=Kribbella hippodromi TaxID=434347 RepID=A0ABP4QE70_9ACTN
MKAENTEIWLLEPWSPETPAGEYAPARKLSEAHKLTPALRTSGFEDMLSAQNVARFDPTLFEDLIHADPSVLRAVARWAARHACAAVGLDQIDWIAAALDGIDRGLEVHAAWHPPAGTFPDGPTAVGTTGDWDPELSGPLQAFVVINSAAHPAPLTAAVTTLWLTIGATNHSLVGELRHAFPQLGEG